MKKTYEEPEIQIRNYDLPLGKILTVDLSDPDLNSGNDGDYNWGLL